MAEVKPILLDWNKETLVNFKANHQPEKIIDTIREQIEELFLIRNPRFKFNPNYQADFEVFLKDYSAGKALEEIGNWFFFPWDKTLVHLLPETEFFEARTARNKNIILADEQEKFYNFSVAIAGMSIGSHAALTIPMMGGAKHIKIADNDTISISNLNRIRYGVNQINEPKCELAARMIYEINPYAEVEMFPQGVNPENIEQFLGGNYPAKVLIEEVDNLEMKIFMRLEARQRQIPVIMATDNGDNVIIDVERYDLDPKLQIFNGVAGDLTVEQFRNFPMSEMPKLATKIAGPKLITGRMQKSLLEVGKTIYSWPQLGDAATLSGVALAYATKRLALGEKVKTGKFEVNLDAIFDPDYHNPDQEATRQADRDQFLGTINLKDE